MGAIKINSADKWFSLCVRERVGNLCERCGETPAKGGLHNSHYHGRGKYSTRYTPDNATALCMGCHLYFGAHPHFHTQFQIERLGPYAFEALAEQARDLTAGRAAKREIKAIAGHYKGCYLKMLQARSEGATGRLELEGWL